MSDWSCEGLWQKAKLYAERALEADRESTLFPMWAAFALEFVARAALANVHPVLLADPQDGKNILHACGYPAENPRSVPTKTVFSRCQRVVPDFTDKDAKTALFLTDLRNQELHTGSPAFEGLTTGAWLAGYYVLCEKLLRAQKRSLQDLFGEEEGKAASEMIKAVEEQITAKVKKAIADAGKAFQGLTEPEQLLKSQEGDREAQVAYLKSKYARLCDCIACGRKAVLDGEKVGAGKPRLDEGQVTQEIVLLPTNYSCFTCGLNFQRHAELHAAGLGGNYTIVESTDPVQYFNIDIAELASGYVEQHFDQMMADLAAEADYGND